MNQRKITQYFAYAIGEILLVVIGILIALYINNWNEQKKVKEQELVLLNNVFEHLRTDSTIIATVVRNTKETIEVQKKLILIAQGKMKADELQNLNLIRRAIPLSLVTQVNNPNLANEVLDQSLKNAVIDYFNITNRGNFVLEHFNQLIESRVRPFLGEKALLNYGGQFGGTSNPELINRERFFIELQKPDLQQVLFEAGIKLFSLEVAWSNDLIPENEKLKQTILTYLSVK